MSVKISFGFCSMICLLGWLDGTLCFWFIVGTVWHELGHVLYLLIHHIPVSGVSLCASGAVLEVPAIPYRQEAAAAAAGPVFSILLGLVLLRMMPQGAVISLLLGIFNLFPLYPLDGGRILGAALCSFLEPYRAERVHRTIRWVVHCGLMLLSCWITIVLQAGLWPIFAALTILWRSGSTENSCFSGRKGIK